MSMVYLNGQFVPRGEATLDIEDRGAMFADGVYEVLRYYRGRPLAMGAHVARLRSSLRAIHLPEPAEFERLPGISDEVVRRCGLREARVYWQVTRGAAPREHAFPKDVRPTVLVTAGAEKAVDPSAPPRVVSVALHEDERWNRCHIKSLMLLPNVLARNHALSRGAYEAVLHRGPVVTEGAATSLLIVRSGVVHTHPANQWILGGITRQLVLDLARAEGVRVLEEPFTVDELLAADEAMLCGTTTHVAAVERVDGHRIRQAPGPVTLRLHAALMNLIAAL